ncbi:MAG: RecB-family nuclease [Candidatus Helarchaeales archaeon]
MNNLLVCLFNVYSIQKMREMTQLIIGFNLNTIIIAKAIGSAAQSGVPDINKMTIKHGKNLIVLQDLPDVLEIMEPSKTYLFVPKPYGKKPFDPVEISKLLQDGEKILLVFGGSEPGLSKKEIDMGESIYLDVDGDLGTIGTAAIALHEIKKNFSSSGQVV